ncbi:hypothetical protein E1B28_011756 [Marasmius oreades]|uniref:F-box domain-containing protein n=1 Tax=Marasmius oreades TaxID=181124 RepID=A0A9P7RW67_9AGAR|nr:uncharacterized protein E1B28_011756 [Marasmius oreades]KAG7090148.1 hypothetical protein E1B28_011756 [Marasmius oreades]
MENQVVFGSDLQAMQGRLDTHRMSSDGHSILPAINAIPAEILINIFRYFQPAYFGPKCDIPPIVDLIRVCKHWRTVALNESSLWSTINLDNPKHFHVTMVRQWLERSKACPLILSLRVYHLHEAEEMTVLVETVLSIFIQHLCRWSSIALHLGNVPIRSQSPLLNLPVSHSAAPLLEKVHIYHIGSSTPEVCRTLWKAIGSYPSVRSAEWIEGNDLGTCLSSVLSAPWKNLIHLTSRFLLDDAFLKFLAGCPTLEFLHIISLHESNSPLNPRPRISLPSLHTLSCSSYPSIPLSQLLDHLEVPKLTSLILNDYCGQWISLLERSACRLRDLSIYVRAWPEVDISQLLLSSPMTHVEKLDVTLASSKLSADSILQALTQKEGVTSLPSLRQLKLYLSGFQAGLLSTMLESRLSDSSCSLRKISLNLSLGRSARNGGDSADIEFLKNLKIDGVDLEYFL